MMAAYTRRIRWTNGSWVTMIVNLADRTVRFEDDDGNLLETRPFDAEETAEADAKDAHVEEVATELALTASVRDELQSLRDSIGAGDAAPGTDTLNAIINTPNATLNGSPASYIKALARLVRALTRATIRLARLAVRDLDTPAE